MGKRIWTRAGVRHKEPKWYWVRSDGLDNRPAEVWRDRSGGTWMFDPFDPCGSSQPWPDDYERSADPIPEPKE